MFRKLAYVIFLLLTLLPFRAFADNDAVCREDGLRYDKAKEAHFEGRVESISLVRGFSVSDSCTFVSASIAGVRTAFYLGPEKFLADNDFEVAVGDSVFITGAPATDSRNRPVMLVRSIRNDSSLVTVRDEEGTPMWMKSPVLMDPEDRIDAIRECSLRILRYSPNEIEAAEPHAANP